MGFGDAVMRARFLRDGKSSCEKQGTNRDVERIKAKNEI